MLYKKIGSLPKETLNEFKAELLQKKDPNIGYQWIEFDNYLNGKFYEIWDNQNLDVRNWKGKWIQKAFYSPPSEGWKVHKDGVDCKTALNIAIQCNDTDWVRWYDEDYIRKQASIIENHNVQGRGGNSRNIEIENYEELEYVKQVIPKEGDVYLVNTDVFHSFKCGGPKDRLIIQTKFEGNPKIIDVANLLKESSFVNLIPCED